jgi:hypothetical protein
VSDLGIFVVVIDSTCFVTCAPISDTRGVVSSAGIYTDEQRKRLEINLFMAAKYPLSLLNRTDQHRVFQKPQKRRCPLTRLG